MSQITSGTGAGAVTLHNPTVAGSTAAGKPSTVAADVTWTLGGDAVRTGSGGTSGGFYTVNMGGGDDTLVADNMAGAYTNSRYNAFSAVDMGAGNDYVKMERSAVEIGISMGTGDDELNFQNSYSRNIDLGDGNDKLIIGPNDNPVSPEEAQAKNDQLANQASSLHGGTGDDTLNLLGEWSLTLTTGNFLLDTNGDGIGDVLRTTLAWNEQSLVVNEFGPFGGNVTWAPKVYGTVTVTPRGPFDGFEHINAVCFTAGTLVETPAGAVRIETLKAGDLVMTQNGVKPVSWAGKRRLDVVDLSHNPKLQPVRIPAGALGNGLPNADVTFSPQHRIVVRSAIAQQMFGTAEVLVPVKHLVGHEGIEVATDLTEVTYIHLMFDEHTTVEVCGIEAETMYPGIEAFKMVTKDGLDELRAIFDDVDAILAGEVVKESCLPLIKGREARALAARHAKNNLPLFAA